MWLSCSGGAGLYGNHLPITTANFKRAVVAGLYTGTVFHKILPGAYIQVSIMSSAAWSHEHGGCTKWRQHCCLPAAEHDRIGERLKAGQG